MLCEKKMSLRRIANGSVQQSFPITRAEIGVGLVVVGRLRFNIFFEEVFDFQLEFIEWSARDIFPYEGTIIMLLSDYIAAPIRRRLQIIHLT